MYIFLVCTVPGLVDSKIVQANLPFGMQCSCSLAVTGMSVYLDLSNDLFTCHQVSFTHFPLWSLTLENGPSDAQRGPRLVKGLPVCGPAGKRCALSLLCDTEGRQARGR